MKRWNWIIPLLSILSTIVLGVTINQSVSLTSFNAGELSPLMRSRVDFSRYRTGAQTLENMLVRAQGPIQRRPGTKYIASVKDATDATRLIPFEYSTTDAYIIELGDQYARFYRNGGQILDPNNDPYEIATPWDANDVFELQYTQDAEVMRLVHPDYQPYKMTRTAHASWTCTAITFSNGPFLDENTDTTSTITPSATTGSITLSGTASTLFDSDHVGSLWQLRHLVDSNSTSGSWSQVLASDQNSATITVYEDQEFSVTTSGTWYGILYIQASYDDGTTWETVGEPFSSKYSANMQYLGRETEDDAIYRLHWELGEQYDGRSDKYNLHYNLTALSFWKPGIVQITAVTDSNDASATVIETLGGTDATYKWSEGAWSDYRGWPRTVEHHEQRCVYGGSSSYPQTIWASIIASQDSDYDDFDAGQIVIESDAWTYVLPGMNPIQWLKSTEYLMVGTTSAVGKLGTPDKPINPTWPPIYRTQAKNGCDYIQPVHAVDAVLYVERGGQKIRELTYTYASDKYVAPDMTILAEHVTGTGLTQIDFQNRPDPILWCVRDDGELLSFTYHRKHDVMAWARQKTGPSDDFESVAVVPGTNEDQVWAVVNRTIDSNSVRYVEQFQPLDWGTDQNDCYFVDSGVDANDNLSHLEGSTVVLWGDSRPDANTYTVSSGAITPDNSYTNETIGLPYMSVYESLPLVAMTNYGASLGHYVRVLNATVDFYETLGAHVGHDSSSVADITFSDDDFATTMDVFTGYKVIPYPRGSFRDPVVYISESSPVPMSVRGLNVDMSINFED